MRCIPFIRGESKAQKWDCERVDVARLLLLIALDFVSPKSMNAAKTQKPKAKS
jgi:hypothetical protein